MSSKLYICGLLYSNVMTGNVRKHARDISTRDALRFMRFVGSEGRNCVRNKAIAALSVFTGLRVGEIANLRWRMVLNEDGAIADHVHLENEAAKKLSGRIIPLKSEVRIALADYKGDANPNRDELIFRSARGGYLRTQSLINWFRTVYASLGLAGASSHSGRRHFVTMAARKIGEVGGSLRDVQDLAGHRALSTTQLYIARSPDAQRKVVDML